MLFYFKNYRKSEFLPSLSMWENMQELVPLSYLRLLPLPPAVMKDKSGQDIPIITSGRIHVGSENGAAGFHLAGRTTVYS